MGDFSIGSTQVQRNTVPTVRTQSRNANSETTVAQRDTFQASNQEWKPYNPMMFNNKNNNVAPTAAVQDDETVSVDSTEVQIKKPASNDAREVRDLVLRKMGFTSNDIKAYKERYPETETGLPKDNGFYIKNQGGAGWATKEEVSGWKTDSNGNTIIEVEGSSAQHLKEFREQRLGGFASMYSSGISDPALRKQFAADMQNLIGGTGEARLEAYRKLTSVQDPQQKAQVAEALQKMADEGGYGDNPWVRLTQANYAEKKAPQLAGPGLENQVSDAQRFTQEALRSTQGNGQRMSREEAAFFQTQVASQLAQSGDKEGAERAQKLARFYGVTDADRQKAQVFDNVANEYNGFRRGFVDRLAPTTNGENSMSAPTDAQQTYDAWKRDPNNQMGPTNRDLQEDPNKVTYQGPGQEKLESRNRQVGGGVGLLEEVNKWGQTYGKMQKGTRIIAEKRQLEAAALNSNRYPVPPKPEELPKLRRQLEQGLGKQEADKRMAEIEQESRIFWNR